MNDTSYPPGRPEFDENAIAVIGMAGRFPGASDVDTYWSNLRDGVESIARYTQEELIAAGVGEAAVLDPRYVPAGAPLGDMEMFDAAFFGFNPREGSILDPQHRHFLEMCWNALEHAGYDPARFSGPIGLFAGSGHNAYMPYNLLTNPELMESVGLFLVRHTGNDKDFMTTRVSYCLDLRGPSINVQTACSTSLVAVHLACQSLLAGECDMALAGGVTIELPHRVGYRYEEGEILSPDGHCRAFDADSAGTVFGSGVGVVVLRRLADARGDGDYVHAVIRGSAVNNDGAGKVGYLAPSVDGQAACIAEALAVANVTAEEISYIETHGTGTPVGDPIEIAALTQAFRDQTEKRQFCGLGSVKTNIGHLDTAAGVASLIKTIQALRHRQLPPSLHYKAANPAIDFAASPFYINAKLSPWASAGQPRRAGISSLGVGGTNAHLIVEEAPPLRSPDEDRGEPTAAGRSAQLLVVSAKTQAALDRRCADLADHLRTDPPRLDEVCHTLQVGRQPMRFRRALAGESAAQLTALLSGATTAKTPAVVAAEGNRPVAFMFAGGGAQFPGMGSDLYAQEPIYREQVERCLDILRGLVEFEPAEVLLPSPDQLELAKRRIERPSVALPLLFTTQYAQATLWQSWGIRPAAFIGHSMGEYTAACLAGVFSLADALRLVVLRGQLFEQVAAGAMLSVPLSARELSKLLGTELGIAATNAPELSVASGPVLAIEALEKRLHEAEIDTTRIHIQVAAHSAMLEPILETFREFWRGIELHPPQLPIASNLTGDWLTPEQATDADYWVRHLRHTVQFSAGVSRLLADPELVLLEVGPGRTLATLARMHTEAGSRLVLASQRHPGESANDDIFMLGALGRLWESGVPVDWQGFHGGRRLQRLPLPTYPFERVRHWIEPGKKLDLGSAKTGELRKQANIGDWFYRPVWQIKNLAPGEVPRFERLLVFARPGKFADRLVGLLRECAASLILVKPGDRYAVDAQGYSVRAEAAEDMRGLVADLGKNDGVVPSKVFHLWGLDECGPTEPDRDLDTVQNECFFSLMNFAQALGEEAVASEIDLLVVSNQLHQVAGREAMRPARAVLLGPCRVIPKEFENVRCRNIDIELPPPASPIEKALLGRLLLDASRPCADQVVAYRGNDRWVEGYEPCPLPGLVGSEGSLTGEGVYLVTGGLGGLGLVAADALVDAGAKNLALLGRGELPERSAWNDWLNGHDPGDKMARVIRQVQRLESRNVSVELLSASVTDEARMAALLAGLRTKFGAIRGVLHTAGTLNDGPLQLKTRDVALGVLDPKVKGTLVLDRLLARDRLDFFVLFSSVSALEGLVGQIDYAAANAFLDAFARFRSPRDGGRTVAIDWTTWREVGMAAELAVDLGLIEPHDRPSGYLVSRNRLDPTRDWVVGDHRLATGEAVMPGTGYLDLLYSGFRSRFTAGAVEFCDIVFAVPFVLPGDLADELRIYASNEAGETEFVVTSDARSSGQVEHVSGKVRQFEDDGRGARCRLEEVLARCQRLVRDYGGRVEHPHLRFGERWQNIERISYGEAEAVVELKLPEDYLDDLNRHPLHPALLDMATGTAQELIEGFVAANELLVPLSYRRLVVQAPLQREMFSHVRLHVHDSNKTSRQIVTFDIDLYDVAGNPLLRIEEFTMQAVVAGGFATDPGAASRDRATVVQKPAVNTGNKILDIGLRDGILPGEGAEALKRVLNNTAFPQVIVSPQPFPSLLAEIRGAGLSAVGSAAPATDSVGSSGQRPALSTEFQQASGETETTIADAWQRALGIEPIGRHDDFYELGGHSLLLTQLASKVRKALGLAPALAELFETPTVAAWGDAFERSRGKGQAKKQISRVSRDQYRAKRSTL